MTILFHPGQGVVLLCDFAKGFVVPEMVKRRPVIVMCKPMKHRGRLCTVLPLSTTAPDPALPYHAEVKLPFRLPPPFDAEYQWIKGDMVYTVSFSRLDLVALGKDRSGKRKYLTTPVGGEIMSIAQKCLLAGLSLTR